VYKGASQNLQGRADRSIIVGVALADARSEVLSPQVRLENLQKVLRMMDAEAAAMAKTDGRHAEFGLRKFELQNECKRLKAIVKGGLPPIEERELFNMAFKDMAFQVLPRPLYDRIMEATRADVERRKKLSEFVKSSTPSPKEPR
jgi:hypothetical protein